MRCPPQHATTRRLATSPVAVRNARFASIVVHVCRLSKADFVDRRARPFVRRLDPADHCLTQFSRRSGRSEHVRGPGTSCASPDGMQHISVLRCRTSVGDERRSDRSPAPASPNRKVVLKTMHSLKIALVALCASSVVACSDGTLSSSSLTGPSSIGAASGSGSAASSSGRALSSATGFGAASGLEVGFSTFDESRIAPIPVPDGISCPTDAPIVVVGDTERRIDVDWSPIPRVQGYQVSIEASRMGGNWQVMTTIETAGVRAEWIGSESTLYRIRVRSRVCNSFGAWSDYVMKGLNSPPPPPAAPTPQSGPDDCESDRVPAARSSVATPTCLPPCSSGRSVATMTGTNCNPPCGREGVARFGFSGSQCAPPCEANEAGRGQLMGRGESDCDRHDDEDDNEGNRNNRGDDKGRDGGRNR